MIGLASPSCVVHHVPSRFNNSNWFLGKRQMVGSRTKNDPENHKPYLSYVADEIEKLLVPGAGDEIDLWFENELFCSVNYWFCL
jgi:hypothetical protein